MNGPTVVNLTLNDVCDEIVDCEHKTAPLVPFGHPSVRTTNIKNGRIDWDNCNRVDDNTYRAWTQRRVPASGDLILAREAPVGEVGLIPEGVSPVLGQRTVLICPDRAKVDSRYLHYLLISPDVQADMLGKAGGSTVEHLNMKDIRALPIPTPPPLPEQRAIARVLGGLDDKIELNRRMNRTLEDLARGLFRSWFVDFDPVTKNGNGKGPAAPAGLFPKRLVDSPIGPIPEGWTSGSIADLARYVNGRNFTKGATGSGRMVVRIAELNSGPGGSTVYNDVKADHQNVVRPGDLLFAWSGSLDVYRWHRDEALVNQHIFKVVCEAYPQWFVHFHLCEAMPFFQGIAADKATTMGHIKREHLRQAELAIPKDTVLKHADSQVAPIYARMLSNERESLRLAVTRDALLPQLLAGDIRLAAVERAVTEVV